jgi:hypothetical protein
MPTDAPRIPKKRRIYLYLCLLFASAAGGWAGFATSDLLDHLEKAWPSWYGVKLHDDTAWRALPILLAAGAGPVILLGLVAAAFYLRHYYLNFAALHETNLFELAKARTALQIGLKTVETIERGYKSRLVAYERVSEQLDELQRVKNIDTEDLRKKLNAIASATRSRLWVERGIAFALGVLSSLVASYIWARVIGLPGT